jgi:hypothetical protein
VLATPFCVFALLPTALQLPAFQILQLYTDIPYCPDDRALRRQIHLIPRQYALFSQPCLDPGAQYSGSFIHGHLPDLGIDVAARNKPVAGAMALGRLA